jgi:hypothetical protein
MVALGGAPNRDNAPARRHAPTSLVVFASADVATCGPSSTAVGNTSALKSITLPPLRRQPLCRDTESQRIDGALEEESVQLPQAVWLQHRVEGFSTHQPMLVHHVRATSDHGGDIWELGAGTGSTPLLRRLAQQSNRVLVTVEDAPEYLTWLKASMPPAPHHRYRFADPNYYKRSGGGGADSCSGYEFTAAARFPLDGVLARVGLALGV